MKSFISFLGLLVLSTYSIAANDCITKDGVRVASGEISELFLVQSPQVELGPNYNCTVVSRVRLCIDGEFSSAEIKCSEYDSGGCVDWWIDQLSDDNFVFAKCN